LASVHFLRYFVYSKMHGCTNIQMVYMFPILSFVPAFTYADDLWYRERVASGSFTFLVYLLSHILPT